MYYLLMVAILTLVPFQTSHAVDAIGADDVLRITVYGYEDLQTDTKVSSDGKITFPLIGEVSVSGKSTISLEEEIAVMLIRGGFIHDAQVNVKVLERLSQQVSVLGMVSKPGRYALESESTIVDLIAMAGGIHENGSNTIVVTRVVDGKLQKQTLDLSQFIDNAGTDLAPFKMKQNDVIYVPRSTTFYIYGEVQKPGAYRLEPGTSVVKALSIGGGLTTRGTENSVVIKRKTATDELQDIDAELNDILVQDDVVYVGERWF